ncbi:P-loop containing nucleoside triphosphate hydrolase protein [Rhizophagus diaphanus]|nr:P-loop containing nucleoside triphosphate hydrolase protein [Rhizophagus diaphanus] [Rhizophagus sp. MUCL 43196]
MPSQKDKQKFVPDKDQEIFISSFAKEELVLVAGPGAGKTTSLCAFIANIMHSIMKLARILVLMYNKKAQDDFEKRLKAFRVPTRSKKNIIAKWIKGCYVVTFHEYGYWSRLQPLDERLDENNKRGYQLSEERAACIPRLESEIWDWVIMDEAQDVTAELSPFIDQLRPPSSSHLVIAGDPHQELYTGAYWFSNFLKSVDPSNVVPLSYNHRSAPRIVAFLNAFSALHFLTLHRQQTATRTDMAGTVTIASPNVYNSLSLEGKIIGTKIKSFCPHEAFVIGPVSVKYYGCHELLLNIRERFYRYDSHNRIIVYNEDMGNNANNEHSLVVGTACKLKGRERKSVMVMKPNAKYQKLLSRVCLIQRLYVALSRAQNDLLVVFEKDIQYFPFFDAIPQSLLQTDSVTKKAFFPPPLSAERPDYRSPKMILRVRDNLATTIEWWKPVVSDDKNAVPRLSITIKNDPDFVELFVKAFIATHCGIEWDTITIQSAEKNGRKQLLELTGVFSLGEGKFMAVYDNSKLRESDFNPLLALFPAFPEYAVTGIGFTIQANKVWTVSERLQHYTLSYDILRPYIEKILTNLSIEKLQWYRKEVHIDIFSHKGGAHIERLIGAVDFASCDENDNIVGIVEMNHTTPRPSYYIEAAIYASMTGCSRAYLLNTKEHPKKNGTALCDVGHFCEVLPLPLDEVKDVTRALFALSLSVMASQYNPCLTEHYPLNKHYIAVDVSFDETAALAFVPGTDFILGLYHKENMDDAESFAEFYQWVKINAAVFTFLYWSKTSFLLVEKISASLSVLGTKVDTIDVRSYYIEWTKRIPIPQSTLCMEGLFTDEGQCRELVELDDAISAVLGKNTPYGQNCAYEYAVMIASVFNGVSNINGIV